MVTTAVAWPTGSCTFMWCVWLYRRMLSWENEL